MDDQFYTKVIKTVLNKYLTYEYFLQNLQLVFYTNLKEHFQTMYPQHISIQHMYQYNIDYCFFLT